MKAHSIDGLEVLNGLKTDAQNGLSFEEVQKRQAEYGANKLEEKKKN